MPNQGIVYEFKAFNAAIELIPDERLSAFTMVTGALKLI